MSTILGNFTVNSRKSVIIIASVQTTFTAHTQLGKEGYGCAECLWSKCVPGRLNLLHHTVPLGAFNKCKVTMISS